MFSRVPSISSIVSRKKFFSFVLIAFICVFVIGVVLYSLHRGEPSYIPEKKVSRIRVQPQDDSMNAYSLSTEASFQQVNDQLKKMSKQLNDVVSENSSLRRQMKLTSQKNDDLEKQIDQSNTSYELKLKHLQEKVKNDQPSIAEAPTHGPSIALAGTHFQRAQYQPQGSVVFSTPPTLISDQKKASVTGVKNNLVGYLPMGSFFKVTLLHGIDAPTGDSAQANPMPVLMRIDGNAILPNKYKYWVKGCFALGSAKGDLSSERVDIRLAALSCVGLNGKAVIRATFSEKTGGGYVVDEDGKSSLRGKVVNRQGAKLGYAMLAGFASGFGSTGAQQGNTFTSPLGTYSEMGMSERFRSAGYGGAGKAMDELAKFYISQAKRLYPVIVVNAGRNATLDLSQGVALHWENISKPYLPADKTTKGAA